MMAVNDIVINDYPRIGEVAQVIRILRFDRDDLTRNRLPLIDMSVPRFPKVGRTDNQDADGLKDVGDNYRD